MDTNEEKAGPASARPEPAEVPAARKEEVLAQIRALVARLASGFLPDEPWER